MMSYLHYKKDRSKHSGIIKIISIYIIVGGLWILFSDSILPHFTNNIVTLTYIATAKGLLFILVTAGLLYFLINNYTNDIKQAEANFQESEKRYEELANSLPQMIFEVNNKGLINLLTLQAIKCSVILKRKLLQGFQFSELLFRKTGNVPAPT